MQILPYANIASCKYANLQKSYLFLLTTLLCILPKSSINHAFGIRFLEQITFFYTMHVFCSKIVSLIGDAEIYPTHRFEFAIFINSIPFGSVSITNEPHEMVVFQ